MFNGNENLFERDFISTDAELINDAIIDDIPSLFYNVFREMINEEREYYIDVWIESAIERNRPEFTAFLLDYKNKHNLYTTPDWNL